MLFTGVLGRLARRMGLASTNGNGSHPPPGSALSQLFGQSNIAGEVRKIIGVFSPKSIGIKERLAMRTDPDVAFGLAILRAPIVNLRWSVESKDPVIKAFVESQLRPRYRQFAKAATNAIGLGYQVVEKVWDALPLTVSVEDKAAGTSVDKRFPMAWTIVKYKAIDPRTITLLVDPKLDEWSGVQQYASRNAEIRPPVGPERTVLWSFRDEDVFGRLEGFPILDQAYEPWWWKAAMNFFANRYYERRADPTLKGRAVINAVNDASGKAVDGFKLMGEVFTAKKQGGDVLLPGTRDKDGNLQFDVEYLTDDKRGDMYQMRIDKLGTQILRGLWITDRAGTSGGGGGIGTGEADVHAETLAGTLEMIVDEFLDEVLNPQVVDPLVEFNFGKEALQQSQTCVKGAGLSSSMRDLLKEVLLAVMNAEQFLANGKKIPASARIDSVGIMQRLELPLLGGDELQEIAAAQNDPAGAAGAGAGAAGDPNQGDMPPMDPAAERAIADRLAKRGVIRPNSLEALTGADAELYDKILVEVDRRVASAKKEIGERRQALAADGAVVPGAPVPIHLHVELGDVNVPPGQTVVNQGDIHIPATPAPPVTVNAGDIHASIELKPGERKTIKLQLPDGKTIKGEVGPKGSA